MSCRSRCATTELLTSFALRILQLRSPRGKTPFRVKCNACANPNINRAANKVGSKTASSKQSVRSKSRSRETGPHPSAFGQETVMNFETWRDEHVNEQENDEITSLNILFASDRFVSKNLPWELKQWPYAPNRLIRNPGGTDA
jgi:hypothetical protein